jgi:uncharacterized membrane-anchored protein YitT (DUF2179 family)
MLGCNIAKKYLPDFDYSAEQIEAICQMIMATKLPQSPTNKLSQLLCDADLYYLGTGEYKTYADKLYKEFKRNGDVANVTEWTVRQTEFLTAHHFFSQTAINEVEAKKQENLAELKTSLQKQMTPAKKIHKAELLQDVLLMVSGTGLAAFALKRFLMPNHFVDGGITGISLLLHELYHINLTLAIVLLNIPLIAVSFFSVGRRFALRTICTVFLLGLFLFLIPESGITNDKLLIPIFGGVFLGVGIGLTMRAGAALDSIEVLALYTLKKTSFTITEIILAINVIIFAVAALKIGIEPAFYSILTYFAATRSIDYVVEGLQAYTGVTIISAKSEAIKHELVNNLGRGITVYKGQRGFLPGQFEVSADVDIIFTVITRLEMRKLKNLVYEVDSKAFVFASTIKEASGGIIRRKQGH